MSKPHALFIAFYFPPSRASGVYRSRFLANHLVSAGWDVTVITANREFFADYIGSVDASLEATVDPRVVVERVRFSGRPWEPDLRRYTWLRANFPKVSDRLHRAGAERIFPETYAPWIPGVVRRGVEVHRRKPVDVIIATGNPHAAFGAAHWLGRLLSRPYAIDYRDSWTLDLFDGGDAYPPEHPAWDWEERLMAGAGLVTFVNDAIRQWHVDRYPAARDKMAVVENGYDPEVFEAIDHTPPADPLTFGFIGTATDKMPLREFFAGWQIARERDAALAEARMHMHGYLGFFRNSINRVAALMPLGREGVSYEGPVPKQEIGAAYERLDVLVLLAAGGPYVTSGKVYEYMATGKPILCVNAPGSGARAPLEGYPLAAAVASLEPEDVAAAIEEVAKLARAADAEVVAACREHARRYERGRSMARLEARLRELVA